LVDWSKSPAVILTDISFVAAGKRRDFCLLLSAKWMLFDLDAR
jgi:hypothetical protein